MGDVHDDAPEGARDPELASDLSDVGALLELAGSLDPVVDLRKFSGSTLICDLSNDLRRKVERLGIRPERYEKFGDRAVWRCRIGARSEWYVARDPATALAEAISRYRSDES